jgi:hypothetical protein
MKYEYKQEMERVGEWRLGKFRAGVGAVKEAVVLSLEKEINKPEKVLYFILRSGVTKVVVYNAFLLAGAKVEEFMGKKENLKLTVFKPHRKQKKLIKAEEQPTEQKEGKKAEGEGKGKGEGEGEVEVKHEHEQVKLQFVSEEDAKSFQAALVEFFTDK